MKLINKKDNASTDVLMIVVPIIISLLLSLIAVQVGEQESINEIYSRIDGLPESYSNMSWDEREAYLVQLHGNYWTFFSLDNSWLNLGFAYQFEDGTVMQIWRFEEFCRGEADDMDKFNVVAFIWDVMTFDIDFLQQIGIYGTVIRLILIISVAVGLISVIWIG